jgi:hypothetical protein
LFRVVSRGGKYMSKGVLIDKVLYGALKSRRYDRFWLVGARRGVHGRSEHLRCGASVSKERNDFSNKKKKNLLLALLLF